MNEEDEYKKHKSEKAETWLKKGGREESGLEQKKRISSA